MEIEIAAASAVASAIASLAALWQVRKAGSATEAAILLAMSERYAQPDMREAIRSLAQLGRDARVQGLDIVDHYRTAKAASDEWAAKINDSCRAISSYFCDAYRLSEAKFISRNTLRYVIYHPGLNVFYQIAVPINESKNLKHNSISTAQRLKILVEKHGDGIY